MQTKVYDILGVGIGPFNLSLAALASRLTVLSVCLSMPAPVSTGIPACCWNRPDYRPLSCRIW